MISCLADAVRRRRTTTVRVEGHALSVPPGVLDPVRFRTGAAWAPRVAAAVARRPELRLLDLGCGCGVVGVLAAAAGARVTASDLDRRACAAARDNGLSDVVHGDLFSPLAGRRFDLICFNPPFFVGMGLLRPYRRALYGGPGLSTLRAFAARAPQHLFPGGQAWVLLSDRAPHAHKALGPGWTIRERWSLPLGSAAPEELTVWARRRVSSPNASAG